MAKLETTIRKFNERWEIIPPCDCWLWVNAFVAPDGYGKMMAFGEQYAHRVSYILHNGPLEKSEDVMHTCDNPSCVNPGHLKKCTHAENMADMKNKGRSRWGEKHPSAKLTADKVIKMRDEGGDIKDYAALYGVAECTVSQAMRGNTWKQLPMSEKA